jgi:hypothetical protein
LCNNELRKASFLPEGKNPPGARRVLGCSVRKGPDSIAKVRALEPKQEVEAFSFC